MSWNSDIFCHCHPGKFCMRRDSTKKIYDLWCNIYISWTVSNVIYAIHLIVIISNAFKWIGYGYKELIKYILFTLESTTKTLKSTVRTCNEHWRKKYISSIFLFDCSYRTLCLTYGNKMSFNITYLMLFTKGNIKYKYYRVSTVLLN